MKKIHPIYQWAAAFLLVLPMTYSCVNEDYDLSDDADGLSYEMTLLTNVTVPLGSYSYTLDDMMTVGKNTVIRLNDSGEYEFYYSPKDFMDPVEVKIDPVSVNGASGDKSFSGVSFADPAEISEVQLAEIDDSIDLNVDDPKINAGSDVTIDSINDAQISGSALRLTFGYASDFPFTEIYLAAGTSITFPEWLAVTPSGDVFTGSANVITATKDFPIVPGGSAIQCTISKIDFSKTTCENSTLLLGDKTIEVKGNVKVDPAQKGTGTGTDLGLTLNYNLSAITFQALNVEATVSQTLQGIDIQKSLPDQFRETGAVSLDDINIILGLNNGLPFDLAFRTVIHANGLAPALEATYPANTNYKVCFAAKESGASPVEANERKYVANLNAIVSPMPTDKILFEPVSIHIGDGSQSLSVNRSYTVTPSITIAGPLAFGAGMNVDLSTDQDQFDEVEVDLGEFFEKIYVEEGVVTMEVVNPTRLNLAITPVFYGESGQKLTATELSVTNNGGAVTVNPGTSEAEIRFTANKVKVSKIGFNVKITSLAPSDVLTKDTELGINNVKLRLVKGVTFDLKDL